jgi:hypothetical protein
LGADPNTGATRYGYTTVAYWTGDGVINSDAQQMVAGDNSDVDRIRLERDLYLGLLGLTNRDDPGAFLEEALGLTVRVLNA